MVEIKEVPLAWQRESVVVVTRDFDACVERHQYSAPPDCEILLRIANANHKWLRNAIVAITNRRADGKVNATDGAGRALLIVKRGDAVIGTVTAFGHKPRGFQYSCASADRVIREDVLVLQELR